MQRNAMECRLRTRSTAVQESRLRNLKYGDRDSQGLFQQRTSQGWGTIAQITNPVLSSKVLAGQLPCIAHAQASAGLVSDSVMRSKCQAA
jgi:hypothetical protein